MSNEERARKIAAATPKDRSRVKWGIAIALAIAVLAGIAWTVYAGKSAGPSTSQSQGIPAGGLAQGEGLNPYPNVQVKQGAPKVDVYSDFQCPICGQLSKTNGQAIDELAAKGEISLVEHHMKFLDENMGLGEKGPSHTAANAAFCAADQGVYFTVAHGIFSAQPEREGDGFPEGIYAQLAEKAGLSGEKLEQFNSCVQKGTYLNYVKMSDESSSRSGITGTPAVKINGVDVAGEDMSALVTQPGSFPQVLAKYAKK
ncbi:DsbA family protein [Gephyromycinifex aptenodytis]|uniref:DsbA family protein n=1 Tax=Gephyromycinifex aptenodytis TaxID=2716227 RepID=UPI0014471137|nr:thioredoxin domain-containing protein [Gephyromycinifex aptenodytis]